MARPAKAIAAQSGGTAMTNEEKALRSSTEKRIRGSADKLSPPKGMSKARKATFEFVISELSGTDMLGNLDVFVLEKLCIAVDMLNQIDEMIDDNNDFIMNSAIRQSREMYSRDFFRCCNELCMSPQSRAKFSISASTPEKKTVRDVLGDCDEV